MSKRIEISENLILEMNDDGTGTLEVWHDQHSHIQEYVTLTKTDVAKMASSFDSWEASL